MRDCYDRCAALVVSVGVNLRPGAGHPAGRSRCRQRADLRGGAGEIHRRFLQRHRRRRVRRRRQRQPAGRAGVEALQDGRLLFSAAEQEVYIQKKPGGLVDAATGKPVSGAGPADLGPVRVNNRVRRAIEAAIGSLTLLSPDPAKRFEAAKAVFKSKDASVLATLDDAIAKETDAARRIGRCWRPAPRSSSASLMRRRRTGWRRSSCCATRGDQDARGVLASRSRRPARRRAEGAGRRHRGHRQPSGRCGAWHRTSGTASRWARCCCSPPSASPSPSASWA